MPEIGCGLDKIQSTDILKLLGDTFTYSGILLEIVRGRGHDNTRMNPSPNGRNYAECQVENYTNEWIRKKDELKFDFNRDSNSCQPPCTEQFLFLRPKQLIDDLNEYYFRYQPQDIKTFMKHFNLHYTDLENE